MKTNTLLTKLHPLMPNEVRKWRRSLDIVDPELRALLEKHIISTAHRVLGDFRSKLLLSLPSKSMARGTIKLGTILYEKEKWPVGISEAELLQNLAIFGRSGAGKTNIAFHIMEQLLAKKIPFLFLDWKRTARHLLPILKKKVNLYTPGRKLSPFPFNPFSPPPSLEPEVYVNHVVDVLADAFTLGDGARSILQKALRACYQAGNLSPSCENILQRIDSIPDKERVRGWKISATRAIESVSLIVSSTPGSQEKVVQMLIEQPTIVELNGLSPSGKKFLTPLLSLWIYFVKLADKRREELSLVLFLEEAHHVLYQHGKSRESLMNMLLRQCREIGIGTVVIDQHPHLISSAALGNTYATISMNLKDPRDVNKAAAVSLVRDEDKHHIGMLPVGQGVVKFQNRWRRPFLVQFPLVDTPKGLVTDQVLEGLFSGSLTLSGLRKRVAVEYRESGHSRVTDRPLSEDELAFIEDVLKYKDDGVDKRYRRLRRSIDKGNRIKNELVRGGILEEESIDLGRTRRTLLRVSAEAARLFGLSTERIGRGSLVHDYWQRWYAELYRKKGYEVLIEAPRRGGFVDVLARKGSDSIAIECVIHRHPFKLLP